MKGKLLSFPCTLTCFFFVEFLQENKDFLFPHINMSLFLTPGGDKVVTLLCALASHIMSKKMGSKHYIQPPNINAKPGLHSNLRWEMLQDNAHKKMQEWVELSNDFAKDREEQKEIVK